MSDENGKLARDDRYDSVRTYCYDGLGRLTATQDASAGISTSYYDLAGNAIEQPAKPESVPAEPRLRHRLEFRLCGSETQQQTLELDGLGAGAPIVAITRVCAYLTGDGTAGAAASQIGGVEVGTRLVEGRVVCTAQLSDFAPGDLVVVQVDVAVYCGRPGRA